MKRLLRLFAVGILQLLHQVRKNLLELLLVAFHEDCVLERVLAELLDFLEISTLSFSTQATTSPEGERHTASGMGRKLMI